MALSCQLQKCLFFHGNLFPATAKLLIVRELSGSCSVQNAVAAAAFWRSLNPQPGSTQPHSQQSSCNSACLVIFHSGHARIIALFSLVWLLVVMYEEVRKTA